jgi:hypothetical protein
MNIYSAAGPYLSIGCFQMRSGDKKGSTKKTGMGEWQGNPELKQGMGMEQ